MRRDRAAADHRAAVRRGARGWKRAGAVDEATLAAVEAAYPDDRVRVGPVLRLLLFAFALLAINAAFGFVWLVFDLVPDRYPFAVVIFAFSAATAGLTELLTGPLRRAQWGVEAAAAWCALAYLAAGIAWLAFEALDLPEDAGLALLLALLAAAAALAGWRWGFAEHGAAAAVLALLLLARAPYGRGLWVVAALVLCPLFFRLAESPRLAPGHRAAFLFSAVVGIAALYLAVNLAALDDRVVEALGGRRWPAAPVPEWLRALAIAGTALLPVALLAWGLRSRRRSVLLSGAVAAVLSLATWRAYVDFAPPWLCLTLLGAAAVAGALAVRRLLESGAGRERGGFTAEPLFSDLEEQQVLEAGATVLTLTPEAAPPRQDRFTGGGGEFGGGGSSSDF